MRKPLVLTIAAATLASACSSSVPGTLTVYSGRSEELVQPLIDRFSEQTGIDVTVRYAGSADLAATILEEDSVSPADVFLAQDPASLGTVALEDLFMPLGDDIVDASRAVSPTPTVAGSVSRGALASSSTTARSSIRRTSQTRKTGSLLPSGRAELASPPRMGPSSHSSRRRS